MYTQTTALSLVNQYISELSYTHAPKSLYDPVEYVLSLGGKRIRPVLMLMAYNMYKDNVAEILSPAVGLEIYHNFTLLHDDLMDKAVMRRNKPTVHKVWDDNTAILSGDAMLVLAYRYVSDCSSCNLKNVLDTFTQAALEVCEGQQYDMDFEHRNDVREEEYIEMIRLKTSVLLAAALKMGAQLAGASAEDAQNLYDFGVNIGIAFQLKDDLLDVYGDPKVFGKNIGGDILCNKKTYMLIKALEGADEQQAVALQSWLDKDSYEPKEKIEAVTALYNQIGVKLLCENKMKEYYAKGIESLARVIVSDEKKKELKTVAEHLMYREM
ncbi:geranylgeranyl diphosphate synthase, type II [Bacteroides luti]|uniref:Geranylgeranyl diphosphate synthase, type II n=1 Tax=Bacteroides luti TaxID=1297750 RepID=A0A1M5C1H0_9BACE|nr:polyprenyl synthetase family protein [Bacteroides luti]SHF48457.1 geranylgeranyl diphosphate synthase, type II [Bacteroides luti]